MTHGATLEKTACIILASGLSRRFGSTNKLLAPLMGKPLGAHCASLASSLPFQIVVSVVPAGAHDVAELFHQAGIETFENPDPDQGQGASLALGIRQIESQPVNAALILLADMPFVSEAHINALVVRGEGNTATASRHNGILQPPLLFSRSAFTDLTTLSGDRGGKAFLNTLEHVTPVDMTAREAIDVDTPDRLAEISRS